MYNRLKLFFSVVLIVSISVKWVYPLNNVFFNLLLRKNQIDMNKKELVKKLSKKSGLTLAQSNDYLNSVLDIISDTLKNREDVFLRGFGSFMIKERKERRTMSLNTKKMITIPRKKIVKFRTPILD